MAINPTLQTTGRDRRMYIWFAVLMPIIVLAGFARSYYLKGFFVLAALIVVVGVLTAIAGAARGATPGPPALQFLVVPLFDMLAFAILVGTALYFRRRRLDIHKRLMLIAAVNLLAPAIARIPLHFIETGGPLAFFGLTDLCLLACVGFDTIKNRRLHPAFVWRFQTNKYFLTIWLVGTRAFNRCSVWYSPISARPMKMNSVITPLVRNRFFDSRRKSRRNMASPKSKS